ncbi:MAG: hypothetical protein WCS31_02705 [Verrucomicrobiae bacterium]
MKWAQGVIEAVIHVHRELGPGLLETGRGFFRKKCIYEFPEEINNGQAACGGFGVELFEPLIGENIPPPTGGFGEEAGTGSRFGGLRRKPTLQARLRDRFAAQTRNASQSAPSLLHNKPEDGAYWPGQMSGDEWLNPSA